MPLSLSYVLPSRMRIAWARSVVGWLKVGTALSVEWPPSSVLAEGWTSRTRQDLTATEEQKKLFMLRIATERITRQPEERYIRDGFQATH